MRACLATFDQLLVINKQPKEVSHNQLPQKMDSSSLVFGSLYK